MWVARQTCWRSSCPAGSQRDVPRPGVSCTHPSWVEGSWDLDQSVTFATPTALTNAQPNEVIERIAAGEAIAAIARKYGTTRQTIMRPRAKRETNQILSTQQGNKVSLPANNERDGASELSNSYFSPSAKQCLSPKKVSERYGKEILSVGTLANWRCAGTGPAYTKIGAKVCYPLDKLIVWEDRHSASSADHKEGARQAA